MAGRYGPALHDRGKRCQLLGCLLRRLARRPLVDQTLWTVGIEDRGNRQEPAGLRGTPRMPSREAAGLGIKIRSKWQAGHGIAPSSQP